MLVEPGQVSTCVRRVEYSLRVGDGAPPTATISNCRPVAVGSAVGPDDLAVQIKQGRDLVTFGPRHAAFGADTPSSVAEVPIDQADLLLDGALCLVLRVVWHEGEVELGRGRDVE